jgi:hypothetical protein
MSAIRTWPVPSAVSGTGGPAGASGVDGESEGSEEKPEHPARSAPVAVIRPASKRRRVSRTTDPLTGKSADKAVLLTAYSAPDSQGRANLLFCRETLTEPER